MTWGTGAYGTSGYGGGAGSGDLTIESAKAVASGTVRVVLTEEPRHRLPYLVGDALNPATWVVTRLDTLAMFTVMAVLEVDPPLTYDVVLLERFGPHLVAHRVAAPTLVSVDGAPVGSPSQADFDGLAWVEAQAPEGELARRRVTTRDLANAPTPRNPLGGTLQTTAGGDYATVVGDELTRKMIARRLTTAPGEFFHLQDFGVGLKVKEPVPGGDLQRLRQVAERQVLREPDVEAARVRLVAGDGGILSASVEARTRRTGRTVTVTVGGA